MRLSQIVQRSYGLVSSTCMIRYGGWNLIIMVVFHSYILSFITDEYLGLNELFFTIPVFKLLLWNIDDGYQAMFNRVSI